MINHKTEDSESKFSEKYDRTAKKYSLKSPNIPKDTPDSVTSFLSKYGLSEFYQGFLWTLDPTESKRDYQPFFDRITDIYSEDEAKLAYPFLRTAFGDVFYFVKENIGSISIVTGVDSILDFDTVFNDILVNDDDLNNSYFLDIFLEANERLGSLSQDECFGFLPTISMGGDVSIETTHKVKLREYLTLVSQSL